MLDELFEDEGFHLFDAAAGGRGGSVLVVELKIALFNSFFRCSFFRCSPHHLQMVAVDPLELLHVEDGAARVDAGHVETAKVVRVRNA